MDKENGERDGRQIEAQPRKGAAAGSSENVMFLHANHQASNQTMSLSEQNQDSTLVSLQFYSNTSTSYLCSDYDTHSKN